ncbi:hypothetical protein FRB97_005941 [Tulasnella sp. 331]|nr:hypothetical protein FRB97_005941 [Tulasnella sp. 331]
MAKETLGVYVEAPSECVRGGVEFPSLGVLEDAGMLADEESDSESSNGSFRSALHELIKVQSVSSDTIPSKLPDGVEIEEDEDRLGQVLSGMSEVQLAALESPAHEVPDLRTTSLSAMIDSPTDTEIDEPESGFSTSPNTSFTSTSGESAPVAPAHASRTPARPILVPEWVPTPQLASHTAETLIRTSQYGLRLIQGKSGERLVEIAYSSAHQKLFDLLNISWSVQWQIGVLVTMGYISWADVDRAKLEKLTGCNADAGPRVRDIFLRHTDMRASDPSQFLSHQNPWSELDNEDQCDPLQMLGLTGGSDGEVVGTYWGGIVEQRAVLVKVLPPRSLVQKSANQPAQYRVELRTQELKLPDLKKVKDHDREAIGRILEKGFLLHGRIFRAFSGHDDAIHLIETDENFGRYPITRMGDHRRMSFVGFAEWFNPMQYNSGQLVCKWSARFALGLSTSIPALIFRKENMFYMPDIISSSHATGKPDSKHVMTDGCGRINRVALRAIQRHRSLPQMPIAIQARVAGAKGVWLLHPDDLSDSPKIWITESQVKIQYPDEHLDDPSKRILDLLKVNHAKSSCQLSSQPIINLSHNGVSNDVFKELFQEGLKEQVDEFIQGWQQHDVQKLWATVFHKSGLSMIRKKRAERGSLRNYDPKADPKSGEMDGLADRETLLDPYATMPGPDPYSGWPSEPLAEQILCLLEAGFLPHTCRPLAKALKTMMRTEVKHLIKPLRIPIKRSAEAFAVPGILEPGEVYFRASQPCELLDEMQSHDGVLTGPVIIFRYPARTPSDCRLVTAVDRHHLFCFTDVLLFSTKGDRSGASILGGGDYDGDTITMITEPRLVNNFVNADLRFADPPPGFFDNTEQYVADMGGFFDRLRDMPDSQGCWELQAALVSGCTRNAPVGIYSCWLDLSTYFNGQLFNFSYIGISPSISIPGYDHPETQYLANMFSLELDSAKSGKHVIPEIYELDKKHFNTIKAPDCLKKADSLADDTNTSGNRSWLRPSRLPEFVLDALSPFADEQETRYQELIEELREDTGPDQDLLEPYNATKARAKRLKEAGQGNMLSELNVIIDFVRQNRIEWGGTFNGIGENSPCKRLERSGSSLMQIKGRAHDGEVDFNKYPLHVKLASKREISRRFAEDLPKLQYYSRDEARAVMASFAYRMVSEAQSQEYAFSVGFQELALMKSRAAGSRNIVTRTFHDHMVPRRGI